MTAAGEPRHRSGLLNVVTTGSIASQFAAGLIWSGLPHYAAVATGQNALYGLLFVINSVAGFLAPMVGGCIPTRIPSISIAVCASVVTALAYMVIANLDFAAYGLAIAVILLVASSSNAMSAPAFGDLLGRIQKAAFQGDLEAGSGHFQTFVMMAKMLGFALGPVAFGHFGTQLLYVVALGFLIEAALLYAMRRHDQPMRNAASAPNSVFKSLPLWNRTRAELAIAMLNGALSFPLISLALIVLAARMHADALTVSAFWFATGATSVCVNALIAKGAIRKIGRAPSAAVATLMIFAALAAVMLAPTPPALIAGFCLFTIGNPVIGALTRNLFFHAVSDGERRVFFGVLQTVLAAGISAGVAGAALIDQAMTAWGPMLPLAALATPLLLRLALIARVIRRFELNQTTPDR